MQIKQNPAEVWQGLMAAKEIVRTANVSRAHWHSLVKEGRAPAPALRIGTRYTRWLARDVHEWLSDPQGWINTHANNAQAVAA